MLFVNNPSLKSTIEASTPTSPLPKTIKTQNKIVAPLLA
jgi:hypothetical protein